MHTGAWKCDHNIACLHGVVVDDLLLIHDADRETGEIILVLRIEARHLGGLTTDQRTVTLYAAFSYALYDIRDLLRHVLAAGDVIEEEQWLRTTADDIVHTHRDAVDADGVILLHQEGDLQLRSDTIGTGYENRVLVALRKLEQTTEAAETGCHTLGHGSCNVLLHQLYGLVAGRDINTCLLVCLTVALCIHI